jgi:hypothetical protein
MAVKLVKINGKSQSLKAWCKELGLGYKAVSERVRRGWDPAVALGEPIKQAGGGGGCKRAKRQPTKAQEAWAKAEHKLRIAACVAQRVDISIRPTLAQILWEIVESPAGSLDDVAAYRPSEPPHWSYEQYRSPTDLAA